MFTKIQNQNYKIECICNQSNCEPTFNIAGLNGKSAQDNLIRITSALRQSGFKIPMKSFNLSIVPDFCGTEMGLLDLPLAIALLFPDINSDISIPCGQLSLYGNVIGRADSLANIFVKTSESFHLTDIK